MSLLLQLTGERFSARPIPCKRWRLPCFMKCWRGIFKAPARTQMRHSATSLPRRGQQKGIEILKTAVQRLPSFDAATRFHADGHEAAVG